MVGWQLLWIDDRKLVRGDEYSGDTVVVVVAAVVVVAVVVNYNGCCVGMG